MLLVIQAGRVLARHADMQAESLQDKYPHAEAIVRVDDTAVQVGRDDPTASQPGLINDVILCRTTRFYTFTPDAGALLDAERFSRRFTMEEIR